MSVWTDIEFVQVLARLDRDDVSRKRDALRDCPALRARGAGAGREAEAGVAGDQLARARERELLVRALIRNTFRK